MSGPIDEMPAADSHGMSTIEVREGRRTNIGRLGIVRILPTKRRRTIGPWCFVDLMTPDDVEDPVPMEIGPHPHIGLATVTWLFEGAVLHSDSLGTEQLIRPGQLNLMTAGNGIAHAEEGVAEVGVVHASDTMGVQMWLAQPESTRHGESAFQHVDSLPVAEVGGAAVRVLIGEVFRRFLHALGNFVKLPRQLPLFFRNLFQVSPLLWRQIPGIAAKRRLSRFARILLNLTLT